MKNRIARWKQSKLVRNTGWTFFGQISSLALQAIYFIVLARLLSVRDYGIFSGVFAMLSTVMPYTALGANMLFMRYVSVDRSRASIYWGNTLFATAVVSGGIAALMLSIGPAVTGVNDRFLLLTMTVSICFCNQLVLCASSVFQTYEELKTSAVLRLVSNGLRTLVVVGMAITLKKATVTQWAVGMLVASLLAMVLSLHQVGNVVKNIRIDLPELRKTGLEGFGFAFAGSTQYAYNDIDKTMLTHFRLDFQNGYYSLAYKIIDFATVPIGSIDVAVLPRYFSTPRARIEHSWKLMYRVLSINVLLGLLAATSAYLLAPWVVLLAGKAYGNAVFVLKIICFLPLLRAIHLGIGSMLTGSGFQKYRMYAQVSAALGNVSVNFWAIPRYGWRGAAYTSVGTDGCLSVILIFTFLMLRHRLYGKRV